MNYIKIDAIFYQKYCVFLKNSIRFLKLKNDVKPFRIRFGNVYFF